MDTPDAKEAFSARMNEICDDMKVPPKDQGRQTKVGAIFKVSQKGARKWLEGEGFPGIEKAAEIAKWAGVNFEWLMTGRGLKNAIAGTEDPREDALLKLYRDSDSRGKDTILRVAQQESTYVVSAPKDKDKAA